MKKKKKVFISLILLFLLIVSGLVYFGLKCRDNLSIDDNAVDYNPHLSISRKNLNQNRIALPGFSKIKVRLDDRKAKVILSNPSTNKVYLKYIIVLKEKEQEIFETALIPPGKAVKGFILPPYLKVGEYDLSIIIKTYSIKNRIPCNSGASQTKLIVLK